MNRPIVKYVVRLALFASAALVVACSNATAPTPASAKKASLKDDLSCPSGYIVVNGVVVCSDPG